jgi:hypothetical protein
VLKTFVKQKASHLARGIREATETSCDGGEDGSGRRNRPQRPGMVARRRKGGTIRRVTKGLNGGAAARKIDAFPGCRGYSSVGRASRSQIFWGKEHALDWWGLEGIYSVEWPFWRDRKGLKKSDF